MSDELAGATGPSGLEPGEQVPNELRILASGENLGVLHSVHHPATLMARIALRRARVYRYDHGVVLTNGRGGIGLYRYDQIVVSQQGKDWFLQRADGVTVRLTRHWSGIEALGAAVKQGAAQAAGAAGAGAEGTAEGGSEPEAGTGDKAAD